MGIISTSHNHVMLRDRSVGHEHATLPRGNLSDGRFIFQISNAKSKDTMQRTIGCVCSDIC